MKWYVLFAVMVLFLFGCISSSIKKSRKAEKLILKENFNIAFDVEKCLYNDLEQTYYLKANNKIFIYHEKKLVNSFGGSGFGELNFNLLSDIYLSSDGSLLALDSFAKTLKKIDKNGHFIAEFSLKESSEPTLFCADKQNRIFVYDNFQKEIIVYENLNSEPSSRWARYDNSEPVAMFFQRNQLVVQTHTSTQIFSPLGYHLQDISQRIWLDEFNNQISLQTNLLKINDTKPFLAIANGASAKISINKNYLVIYQNREIKNYEIVYEKSD